MAYERPSADLTRVAHIMKYDDTNEDMRLLINVIYEALVYSNTNISTKTVAQLVTDLTTELGR